MCDMIQGMLRKSIFLAGRLGLKKEPVRLCKPKTTTAVKSNCGSYFAGRLTRHYYLGMATPTFLIHCGPFES